MTKTRCCTRPPVGFAVHPPDKLRRRFLGRDLLVVEHVGQSVLRRPLFRILDRVNLWEHLCQASADRHQVVAALGGAPGDAICSLVRFGELLEEVPLLESAFDSCDDEVLGQSDVTVELREENLPDRVRGRQRLAALDLERERADLSAELDLPKPPPNVLASGCI
jgi:hypothetical protein